MAGNQRAKAPRSKRAKGKRLEQIIAGMYRKIGIDARPMPMSGGAPGGFMKADIAKRHYDGWVDECKCQERVTLWQWWGQAVQQVTLTAKPVLHISGNHRPVITVLRTEDYMELRALAAEAEGLIGAARHSALSRLNPKFKDTVKK